MDLEKQDKFAGNGEFTQTKEKKQNIYSITSPNMDGRSNLCL